MASKRDFNHRLELDNAVDQSTALMRLLLAVIETHDTEDEEARQRFENGISELINVSSERLAHARDSILKP